MSDIVSAAPRAVLATVASDSHTWNLVYLQLVLEESGFDVDNLGACTPVNDVVEVITGDDADLLVVSSVNGHGAREARQIIEGVRASGFDGPAIIGGKLGCGHADDQLIPGQLMEAGFTAVYMDGAATARPIAEFEAGLKQIVAAKTGAQGVRNGSA